MGNDRVWKKVEETTHDIRSIMYGVAIPMERSAPLILSAFKDMFQRVDSLCAARKSKYAFYA
jgi:hypothetical protein